jgi:hypothetical protein
VQTRFFFVDEYEAVVLVHDLGLERWRNSRFDLVSTLIDVQRTATHPKRDGLVAEPSADRRRLKNRRKQHHVFALWKHYFVKRWRVLSLQMSFGLVLGQILQQCGLKGEQNFSQVALQVVGGVEVDKIWPKSGQKPFFLVVGDAAQIEESNRSLGVAVKELDFEALAHGGNSPGRISLSFQTGAEEFFLTLLLTCSGVVKIKQTRSTHVYSRERDLDVRRWRVRAFGTTLLGRILLDEIHSSVQI